MTPTSAAFVALLRSTAGSAGSAVAAAGSGEHVRIVSSYSGGGTQFGLVCGPPDEDYQASWTVQRTVTFIADIPLVGPAGTGVAYGTAPLTLLSPATETVTTPSDCGRGCSSALRSWTNGTVTVTVDRPSDGKITVQPQTIEHVVGTYDGTGPDCVDAGPAPVTPYGPGWYGSGEGDGPIYDNFAVFAHPREDGVIAESQQTVDASWPTGTGAWTLTIQIVSGLDPEFTAKPHGETIGDFGKVDFDASASKDPLAAITSYSFDFGDGSPLDNAGSPTREHTYLQGGDYIPAMHFTDAAGNTSPDTTRPLKLCPRDPIPVTLPAVDISYSDPRSFKPYGLRYDKLPLRFGYQQPSAGVLCSFTGSGVLKVHIGLDLHVFARRYKDLVVDSFATARLDFLRPGTAPPTCRWSGRHFAVDKVAHDCVVGGAGEYVVRWHTEGFDERWPCSGDSVLCRRFNSGPLTYYARVSGGMTFAQAIGVIEPLLHVELTHHLGWIKPLYMIQEPPAQLQVVDAAGRVTGVPRLGAKPVRQIPNSAYLTGSKHRSAVLLFAPKRAQLRVRVLGRAGSRYAIDAGYVAGAAAANKTRLPRLSGRIGRARSVAFACRPPVKQKNDLHPPKSCRTER